MRAILLSFLIACGGEGASAGGAPAGAGGSGGGAGAGLPGPGGAGVGAASVGGGGGGAIVVAATNPVLTGDRPDPSVLRLEDAEGPIYYLTHTVHNAGDFPLFSSRDLIHWTEAPSGLFGRTHAPDQRFALNNGYFCSLWAPQLFAVGPGSFMLSFTAQRYASAGACGPYLEDSGVYLASSAAIGGPYAPEDKPWEPFPAGANEGSCPAAIRGALPRSVDYAAGDCQGTFCHHIVRLDSEVFRDPADGRAWLGYAWYTNTPPQVAWELDNHGEHVNLVELDAGDPYAVRCDPAATQIALANPHDAGLVSALASSCPGCDQMLSFTRGRQGEEMVRDGVSWGVAEGPSLFRRGGYVYAMISGSAWDSAYYHVAWIAAPTVEELAEGSPTRIAGRYLIPSQDQSFGHGSAVLGPDGVSLYYVHHHLDHGPCQASGACQRDVWVSPIEFEDRGDGLGDVHVKARRPAAEPSFEVRLPN